MSAYPAQPANSRRTTPPARPAPTLTYDEAMSTLQTMFSGWTHEALDKVLRDQQWNMERTIEVILSMDSAPPSASAVSSSSPAEEDDAALARRLSIEWNSAAGPPAPPSSSAAAGTALPTPPPSSPRRGKPTTLPADFLRVPGAHKRSLVSPDQQLMMDEQLARMLQDEPFLNQLRNDPEFRRQQQQQQGGRHRRPSQAGYPADRRPSSVSPSFAAGAEESLDKIRKGLGEMGDTMKRRVNDMYARFKGREAGRAHVPLSEQEGGEEEGEVVLFQPVAQGGGGGGGAGVGGQPPLPPQQQGGGGGGGGEGVGRGASGEEEVVFSSSSLEESRKMV